MLRFIKTQPVFIFGLLELVIGALIAAEILAPELGGSLGAILAFIAAAPKMGVVWNAVTPVVKVVDLATEVGMKTAEQLSGDTAGAIGVVTERAQGVVDAVVETVVGG